jgi:hypothetical protein
MKITPKILSIPPYLSARWSQVHSLYMRERDLIICLADGNIVSIPNLTPHEIEAIFAAHSVFSETQQEQPKPFLPMQGVTGQNIENVAMHFNLDNIEAFSSAFHHNPEHAHIPNLPPEILTKIAAIAKIVAPGEIQNIPKPEPHCNCPHCQIARAIHEEFATGNTSSKNPETPFGKEEEIVNDKDLVFQQWEIIQIGDKLYSVINRLDSAEKYNVFLGEPVGCTCGVAGCEHILAVLRA